LTKAILQILLAVYLMSFLAVQETLMLKVNVYFFCVQRLSQLPKSILRLLRNAIPVSII